MCTFAARKAKQIAHGIHGGGIAGGSAGDAQAHAVRLVCQRRLAHRLRTDTHGHDIG